MNVHKSLLFKVFAKLGKFQARVEPERSSRGPRRPPGAALSWPRQAPSWVPWTPTPTPPRPETFLLLLKFLLYICPDSPGTVSRDFVCFLSRSVSASVKGCCWRCLLVIRAEKISWAVVYVNSSKTTIKEST